MRNCASLPGGSPLAASFTFAASTVGLADFARSSAQGITLFAMVFSLGDFSV
jgi:hypothetical protein